MDLSRCSLAAGSAPVGCDWCGKPLGARWRAVKRERWCSAWCSIAFRKNHLWTYARKAAISRDGGCVRCGSHNGLEVNHIVPLASISGFDGDRGKASCVNHLDGLETLCHDHHVEVTRQQRAAGLI